MFNGLGDRFSSLFDKLSRKGRLSTTDIDQALRDIRTALLEADVALSVVQTFITKVRTRSESAELIRSVNPAQQIVKIVHDTLVETLQDEDFPETSNEQANTDILATLALAGPPPQTILMVGLQGSGKTTTTAKLARLITNKRNQRVLIVSLDTSRPAAQEQLEILGKQADVLSLPIIAKQSPIQIAKRALDAGKLRGADVIIFDTAGRLQADHALMQELKDIADIVQPSETLLAIDSMTGQDAIHIAEGFKSEIALTGIVLTRVDGDSRGGAALSMRSVIGKPIKFLTTGEKLDAIETFSADRIARRILQMGDMVSLVERAQETMEQDEAEKIAAKMKKGNFDLNDMAMQLKQLKSMGGMEGLMAMMPGANKMRSQMKMAGMDESVFKRQEAILSSMSKQERTNPKIIHASRKRRIAQGSGTSIQDINKLLKQYMTMAKMMKKAGKLGEKGMMRSLASKLELSSLLPK